MANILIVDDSPVDRMLLRNYAEKIPGCSVIEAENGKDALAKMNEWEIDLVVTDLQMPQIDGLELVALVREKYLDLPVIVATAHGSESIASQALSIGASGYISKSDMQDSIVPTIKNVLSLLNSQRSYANLIDCSNEINFKFCLENDPSLFPPLVDLCEKMLSGISPLDRIQRLRIGIAVEQALRNAMFRGNLELDETTQVPFGDEAQSNDFYQLVERRLKDPEIQNRKIRANINITRNKFSCEISDDGNGFHHQSKGEMVSTSTGRGLVLIKAFMTEVKFNETGNRISMSNTWNGSAANEQYLELPADKDQHEQASNEKGNFGELVSKNTGRSVPLNKKRLVIGSGPECHLRIKNKSVAAYVCLLTFVNDHWVIQALDKSVGVRVNGEVTNSVQLDPGDIIAFANFEFEIRYNKPT